MIARDMQPETGSLSPSPRQRAGVSAIQIWWPGWEATSSHLVLPNTNRNAAEKALEKLLAIATSTDLRSEEVEAVAEALNPVIADAFALYVKAKNYH